MCVIHMGCQHFVCFSIYTYIHTYLLRTVHTYLQHNAGYTTLFIIHCCVMLCGRVLLL